MTLHRRIPVGLAMPEVDPSITQAAPTFGAGDLVQLVKIPGPGTLLWWGVGKDGNTNDAKSVAGTTATLDARLVLSVATDQGVGKEYTSLAAIGVALGGPLPWGRLAIERDLPDGGAGWLILSALAVGGSGASHLWMSYRFIRGGGVGV